MEMGKLTPRISVPTKSRMKFDAAVEFVRVRILKLAPTTVERKHFEALFDEILRYRYARSKGIASTLHLKLRRWSMCKAEREEIVEHVLRTVSFRICGDIRQPLLHLPNGSIARMRDTSKSKTHGAQALLPLGFLR